MTPLVSVIMICRNGERFLAEAIDSLFRQGFAEWELIFVDDGSTDGSLALAGAYAKRDPGRVRLIIHPQGEWKGTAASRNLGLLAARGKYVTFLDADDVYEPDRLARHQRCMDDNPGLGVVISHDLYWRSWGRTGRRYLDAVIGPAVTPGRPIPSPGLLVGTLLTRGAPLPGLCSVTFRRSALRQRIPAELIGHYEDQALLASALLRETSMVLDEVLCRYRQHPWSITHGNDPREDVSGSPAAAARASFLAWLRHEISLRRRPLPELEAWIATELNRLRADELRPPERLLPVMDPLRGRVAWLGRVWKRRRRRMAVMAHVQRFAELDPVASSRAYWDHRVQDLPLSQDAVGTPGFISAHDGYRHRKAGYLSELLGFDGWRDRAVLDVGCGIGLDLLRFARAGASVTGVDLSATAVEIARRNCAAAGVSAHIVQGDATCLPFSGENFDLVVGYALLPFVQRPEAVIDELLRVLRPGGTAILMAYNRRSWMWFFTLPFGGPGGHADAPIYRQETPASWRQMCKEFAEVQTWTDRFPAEVPGGYAGARALAAVWKRIPARLTRNLGWHLLAVGRKTG